MKKLVTMLLLIASVSLMGQSKTLISISGEKVIFEDYWKETGNSGLLMNSGIGTLDAVPLVFKRNNIRVGTFSRGNVAWGINALSNYDSTQVRENVAVGNFALSATNNMRSVAIGSNVLKNATGSYNVGIGFGALESIVSGSQVVGIGYQSLYSKVNVAPDVALGYKAGLLSMGSNNVMVGYQVFLSLATGDRNEGFGSNVLSDLVNGSNNVIAGYNTGLGITTGSGNTILGANVTGLPANLSNAVIIADGDGNRRINIDGAGNVGLGTDTPTAKLEINTGGVAGAIKIIDGTQGNGKVLTSNIDGLAVWQAPLSAVVSVINGVLTRSAIDLTAGSTNNYIGSYIDLTPGNWIIHLGLVINAAIGSPNVETNTAYAGRFTLSDSTTSIRNNSFSFRNNNDNVFNIVSIGSVSPEYALFVDGIMAVNISSPTRLYLWNALSGDYSISAGSIKGDDKNYFYAIKTN